MEKIVPTVQNILDQTAVGWNYHDWPAKGGVITITTEKLKPLLEEAYDPGVTAWPNMVNLENSSG
jgi:hypothetical protein